MSSLFLQLVFDSPFGFFSTMGRTPCCEKIGIKRGPWTKQEDQKLIAYVTEHGHGSWKALPKKAGKIKYTLVILSTWFPPHISLVAILNVIHPAILVLALVLILPFTLVLVSQHLQGLLRCGKSCRLRWTNYLRPDIKRGEFTSNEEQTIIQLHSLLGNRYYTFVAFSMLNIFLI